MTTNRQRSSDKVRKTAIAVPASLLAAVDAAASERGESRSRFIQRVLREAVHARSDADVRRRVNELFSDDEAPAAQADGARFLERAGARWPKERW